MSSLEDMRVNRKSDAGTGREIQVVCGFVCSLMHEVAGSKVDHC